MKYDIGVFHFPEQVTAVFEFLKEDQYSCAATSILKVRYESRKVFLEISLGELDGEISISFGRINKNEEFSFTLFLRLVNPALEKQLGERLVERPDQVSGCLTKLAAALKVEGQGIISGEDSIFDRMKHVRWWDFQPDALKGNCD